MQSGWQRFGEWLVRSSASTPYQARQGRLAAVMLLICQALSLTALIWGIALAAGNPQLTRASIFLLGCGALIVPLLIVYLINRRGLTSLAGVLLALILLGVMLALVALSGPQTPNAVSLVLPVIIAGLLGPPAWTVVIAILAGGGYLWLNLLDNPHYLSGFLKGELAWQAGLVYLNLAFVAILSWLLSRTARQAVIEGLQLSLALVEQREELERRLAIQTQQLHATTTVARAVAGSRDPNQLLEDIVRLVRETFGYYHVQVFLVDENREYAVLRQSTGEVGQALLGRGHRLPVGSLSVIGQVTALGQPVIARDTDTDAVHRRNELLPLTRSEIAVPLMVGDQVIGALDMQSLEPNAFAEEMIPTFQALADQLAIAIENARLYEQTQENLRELRELSRDVTQRSWAEFLAEARQEERVQIHGQETKALQVHRSRVAEQVLSMGRIITSTGESGELAFIAAPIVVRDEVVGVLGVEPDGTRIWTQEDIRLMQGIADRVGLAVEKARLYFQTRRAAERERLINTIAARLQRAPSLAMLVESAARELAEALGTENVYAEISLDRPLAHKRKRSLSVKPEAIEDETKPVEGVATDESKKARAEL